jgi:hypothetical protein
MDVYLNPELAPLDKPVPDIGDWQPGLPVHPTAAAAQYQSASQTNLIIPFTRLIESETVGNDVKGIKRGLWPAAGLKRPKAPTGNFGATAVKLTKQVQAKHHLAQDGEIGPATLKVIAPYMDAFGYLLYEGFPPPNANETWQQQARSMIVSYNLWAYNNRVPIHYGLIRPMQYMSQLYRLPVTEDCSTLATKGYAFAHERYPQVPDPCGFGFNGSGNTSSMMNHGTRISIGEVQPGDLCLYNDHVTTFVTRGVLPNGAPGRVVSNGSEVGPLLLNWNYRPDTISIRSYL